MNTDQKQDHTAYQEPQAIQELGAPAEGLDAGSDTGYTTNQHPYEKVQAHPATNTPLVAPPSYGGTARGHGQEAKLCKVQRKWQEELRDAQMSDTKVASWKGLKSKATKGISRAINRTTAVF
ncbi:hypothetical protein DICSQDRAFT_170937 [Dichomitus squalens LYAD-421 SS1]|uniref:Uncharacterized protein n=1 Tax=Dichomitus squalens (strain LYAD-421) TaxID=732165 RepID=R7SXM6_DICSQ|nr:uncharacterized protein DICSQDRAFT_170937 [Dichomitus squalens LYAD-421 SS1]EJF60490.1 hypothetical protein DICSQDRAFT_170937 [Dichomitus squalens LYAD-421 SS1]